MCLDFAFTFGVLVRRSWVTSGRSTHGHTARSAPTSKTTRHRDPVPAPGGWPLPACEIDSSTRRHLRFWGTDSSGPFAEVPGAAGALIHVRIRASELVLGEPTVTRQMIKHLPLIKRHRRPTMTVGSSFIGEQRGFEHQV